MNDSVAPTPRKRALRALAAVVLVLAVLGLLGWRGWIEWQAREARLQARADESAQRLLALEGRIEALRRDQRVQTQRIQDAASTNRILRDEVLGLGQRSALLEDSVAQLSSATLSGGPQALRLDEVELLLGQGAQRLAVARDVDGALRAYALAAGALEGVDDPKLLNLRQALAQERAALEALGDGPQAAIAERLQRFTERLPALEDDVGDDQTRRPAWQRALAPLIEVRRTRGELAIAPSERAAGAAALQIELSLARAALERGDAEGFRTAIDRIDAWLQRLWPDGRLRRSLRSDLQWLRAAPVRAEVPELGTTLEQLRALRGASRTGPGPTRPPVTLPPPQAAAAGETP